MRKLYLNFSIALSSTFFIYTIFFACQNDFAQSYYKSQQTISDSINKQAMLKLNSEVIQSIGQKVDGMAKYVDASQKNLDLWLKLLAFILSILIGYSIFSGLRTRELAKEELAEIRRLRESINREANDAQDRLNNVKKQLTEIENTAVRTKIIEEKMTETLKEFGDKSEIALNDAQKKKLDKLIEQTKGDLQLSGIEAFKNLYFAKSIKARDIRNWEEVIRLTSSYIDLDENNATVYGRRGLAYHNLSISPDNPYMLNKALDDYSEALRLNPEYIAAYETRSILYRKIGKIVEADSDIAKAKELKGKANN